MDKRQEAMRLLEEAVKELEQPKGSVASGVQKIYRAAGLVDNDDIEVWCAIQLGDSKYISVMRDFVSEITEIFADKDNKRQISPKLSQKMTDAGLNLEMHYSMEELVFKSDVGSGGLESIGFIEEKYADLVRRKTGNDNVYYKSNLNRHIAHIRHKAHKMASNLLNQIKFAGTVSNCFDILKNAVDDRLLDLNPVIAEQLMLAFKAVSSSNSEEWSQALTTCRRLLEGLADDLHPASKPTVDGRSISQNQYVNRLWAFMDVSIQSASNKALAKAHVDFLGSWLEQANKLANKGVHAELTQLEAVKAVFHVYLVVADLLEYLNNTSVVKEKPNIKTATLDEIEALLGVNRNIAKEIVKARVNSDNFNIDELGKVQGIGTKTLDKAKTAFLFEA